MQIGIILAVCLALVLAAVLGGNCTAADDLRREAAADGLRREAAAAVCFNATALSETLSAAGFYSYGNLYAYTLIPKDGAAGNCKVSLSTTDTVNDTLTLRFTAVRALSDAGDGALLAARAEEAGKMRVWQTALLDALALAMSAAGAEAPVDFRDGVLLSVDDGKAYADRSDAFSLEGGYTDAEDKNVYVLTVRAVPAE